MAASSALTSSGYNSVLGAVFSVVNGTQAFQYFGIGTDSTAASTADTGLAGTITNWTLEGSSFKSVLSITLTPASELVTIRAYLATAEATGKSIYEYVDLNGANPKVPCGRFVWADPITKTTANQVTIETVYSRV